MIIKKVVIDKNKQFEGHLEGTLGNLKQLPQPVKELFYTGDLLNLVKKPCVAIVGSRKVSSYGREVTIKLATNLAKSGVTIISGMALGVDSIAHQAVLDAGGKTIAVLPSGLDYIYPRNHFNLANNILNNGGALVSEYPEGSGSPQKYQFIARNRIIAALSQGVIITEAAAKSGSLHTADFAVELGLEVFAVPGNIINANSEGTNNLIKNGAAVVTTVEDILETLNIQPVTAGKHSTEDEIEKQIIEFLSREPLNQNDLLVQTALAPDKLNQALTMLEINQVLRSDSSGRWYLT